MLDNIKIITKLLTLSQVIMDDIDILANLSYFDMEKSPQFDKYVKEINDYLNQEQVLLSGISLDNLITLYKELTKYDDDSDAYIRCMVNLDDRINLLHDQEEVNDSYNIGDEDFNEDTLDEENDEFDLEKYHLDEGENEKYAINVIDNMATVVIKKMLKRIEDTLADNRQDNKYKKKLIKSFRRFKYFYFTLDNQLEILGASYHFDINKIPMPTDFNIDTSQIFYNQCVTILDKLYAFREINFDPETLEEVLFNVMLLEEYLSDLPNDLINRLRELIPDFEEHYGKSYYGDIAKTKILLKKD